MAHTRILLLHISPYYIPIPSNKNNKYIIVDDATPNPLEAPFNQEEALLDAGEEAAATAMEA